MWVILIIIAIIILAKFFLDSNKQSKHVNRQGGMIHKYRILINYIKQADPRATIFKVTSTYVSIGTSNAGGTTVFEITQTFGKVTLHWRLNSPLFGKHSLEWEFDEYLDQNLMIDKIENDIEKYQMNILTS